MASTTSPLLSNPLTLNDLENLYRIIAQALIHHPGLSVLEKNYFRYLNEDKDYSRDLLYSMLNAFKENESYKSKLDLEKIAFILHDIREGKSARLKALYQMDEDDKNNFIDRLITFKTDEQDKISQPNLIPSKIKTGMTPKELIYTRMASPNALINLAIAVTNEGIKYHTQKNWIVARRCFQEAIRLAQEAKDDATASKALRNLVVSVADEGEEYHAQKKWIEARRCFKEAIQLAREANDDATTSLLCKNLAISIIDEGVAYGAQNHEIEARRCFEEAIPLAEEAKDNIMVSLALTNLAVSINKEGVAYLRQKNWIESQRCFKEAIRLAEKAKDKKTISLARKNLFASVNNDGREYLAQKNWTESDRCFKEAEAIAQEEKDEAMTSHALINFSLLAIREGKEYHAKKNWVKASECFKKAEQFAQKTKDNKTASKARELLFLALTEKGIELAQERKDTKNLSAWQQTLDFCISKAATTEHKEATGTEFKTVISSEDHPFNRLKLIAEEICSDIKPLYDALFDAMERRQRTGLNKPFSSYTSSKCNFFPPPPITKENCDRVMESKSPRGVFPKGK